MGGVAIVDSRLIDLAPALPEAPTLAYRLANTQYWTHHYSGHIIALNDEFVWRRLKAARATGETPRVRVRCLTCGVVASLRDWERTAPLWPGMREELRRKLAAKGAAELYPLLEPCPGLDKGWSTLMTFGELCGSEFTGRWPLAIHGRV